MTNYALVLTGAEERVLSANGGGLWDSVINTPTISTTVSKNGSCSFRFNKTSSSTCYVTKNMPSGDGTYTSTSFYIRVDTKPTGTIDVMSFTPASGNIARFIMDGTNSKFGVDWNGTDPQYDTNTFNTGTWYLIDLYIRLFPESGNRYIRLSINGNYVTQSAYAAGATTTLSSIRVGSNVSGVFDYYIDDIVATDTQSSTTSYIGEHICEYLYSSADGTHNAGTNIIEAQDGTDIGTTTAYDKINSVPTSAPSSTTYIRQANTTGSYYAQTTLSDITTGRTPVSVMGFLAYTSSATQANRAASYCKIDANTYEIWGISGTLQDYSDGSTSNLYYKSKMFGIATPTADGINSLTFEFGLSSDVSPNPYCIDVWVVVATTSTGVTQAIGIASETDSTLAVKESPRRRLVGITLETDTSLGITKKKAVYLGISTETDSSLAFTKVRKATLGLPFETDTALSTNKKKVKSVEISTETDSALALTKKIEKKFGISSETDSALSIRVVIPKNVAVGIATETDTSLSVTWSPKKRFVNITLETDTALPASKTKLVRLGITTETDTSLSLTKTKKKTVEITTETDTSLYTYKLKRKALGISSETDTTLDIKSLRKRAVGITSEVDTALSMTKRRTVILSIVSETNTALSQTRKKTKTFGINTETDSALSISVIRPVFVKLGIATETDSALTLRQYPVRRLVSITTETDTSLAISIKKIKALGISTEVDSALAMLALKPTFIKIGIATETDSSLAVKQSPVRRFVSITTETDTSLPIVRKKIRILSLSTETDSALRMLALKPAKVSIGIATETDSALAVKISPYRRFVGITLEADYTLALSSKKVKQLGISSETDSSLGIKKFKTRPINLPTETDFGLALKSSKIKLIDNVLETDSALSIVRYRLTVQSIGITNEEDYALSVLPIMGTSVEDRIKVKLFLMLIANRREFVLNRRRTEYK